MSLAGDGERAAAGELGGKRSRVDSCDADRPAAHQLGAVEIRNDHVDAQRKVVAEVAALGDDKDTVADVGFDAVDQVVVGVDDDRLYRSDMNGDVADAGQIDRTERRDGS